VSILNRFKSNEKLQAEALVILKEMIRRNLLSVSVSISDPSYCVSCPVMDAYALRFATKDEIAHELITGEPIKTKGAEGIALVLNQRFRMATDDEAHQLRDVLVTHEFKLSADNFPTILAGQPGTSRS
jgi:hypothetical protein